MKMDDVDDKKSDYQVAERFKEVFLEEDLLLRNSGIDMNEVVYTLLCALSNIVAWFCFCIKKNSGKEILSNMMAIIEKDYEAYEQNDKEKKL